ncbi:MAG: glycoside hydrolase family 1 protein [Candidatus Izemoplasmatales bacterium]
MGTNNLFPQNFLFGAATSAYQIEGAAFEDGRGKTYWDTANRDEQGRPTGDVGDIACDHYHRYVEDVQLMKKLGLQVYRFSISWVRIFPHGHGDINQAGVDFYDRLLDELDRVGIIPAVTIWHGDLPLDYDQIGGWTNPLVIEHYLEYAQFLFSHFGKRVKLWFTHNEPWCAAFLGDAPMNDKLMVAHHLLVAHAKCVRLYRHMFPNTGEIGIVLNLSKQYPATKNP